MKNILNSLIIGGLGVFCAVFLLNPGFGLFAEIPDNIPIIGHLDEAAAAALLISCLAYFGLDLGRLFGKAKEHESRKRREDRTSETIDAEAEVVEER